MNLAGVAPLVLSETMRWEIKRVYTFEAAHSLPYLPEGHKCRNHHGHSYTLTVCVVSNQLNRDAMVMDFAEIDKIVKPLVDELDHTNLNDRFKFTTSECLALEIYNLIKPKLPTLDWVEISETSRSSARVCL